LGQLVLISFFVLPALLLGTLYWIFSADSFRQGFTRLLTVSAICFLLFWVIVALVLGLALEEEGKQRQRTTGESFFGMQVNLPENRIFAARFGKGAAGGNSTPKNFFYEKPRDCRV